MREVERLRNVGEDLLDRAIDARACLERDHAAPPAGRAARAVLRRGELPSPDRGRRGRRSALVEEDTDLAGRVAGKWRERDVAGFGQAQALRERPERFRLELEQGWVEPDRAGYRAARAPSHARLGD